MSRTIHCAKTIDVMVDNAVGKNGVSKMEANSDRLLRSYLTDLLQTPIRSVNVELRMSDDGEFNIIIIGEVDSRPEPTTEQISNAIESLIRQGLVERGADGRTRVTAKRPPWKPEH